MAFGFTEPGLPPIPALVAWQNNNTQTFTTNTNVHLTAGTSTAGLYPGMGVAGTNIPAGSFITLIVSGTAFDINQAATGSGAQSLTFTYFDPWQSQAGQFMGTGFTFPSPSAAAVLTDVPDCAWNIPDTQVLAAAATYVPAPGRGWCVITSGATTGCVVQYNIAPTPTWTTIYTQALSTTGGIYLMTDGVNVRYNNLSSAASTYTFYRERSSKSTSI